MSDLTAPNNQQNQPYWADLRYSETLAQKLSVLHELDMSLSASPMVSLKFKEDKQTTHIASPPGFLSATNIEALNDQLDYIALNYNKKNAASAFLQYRGHDVKSEISNLLSKYFEQDKYEIAQRIRVNISLNEDEEDLLMRCRRDTRSRLRQMMKAGYSVKPEYDKRFHQYYDQIAKRNGFSAAYCYSAQDLETMLSAHNIYAISIYDAEQNYAGGSVIGVANGAEHDYILSAYNVDVSNSGRAVLWYSILQAKAMGASILNLGGGIEEEDSLYEFKTSFGGEDAAFYTLKIVLDEELYRATYALNDDEPINMKGRFPAL